MSLTPLQLIKQKEEINEKIKQVALGTPDITDLTAEGLKDLLKQFENVLSWTERSEMEDRWTKAYIQQQRQSPNYVRSLLEIRQGSNTVDAEPYRQDILNLLHSEDATDEWFKNTVNLNIKLWSLEQIKHFPIKLIKAYILYLPSKELSEKAKYLLARVEEAVDEQLFVDVKLSFREPKRDEYDNNFSIFRSDPFAMTCSERLLVSIALLWHHEIQKDSFNQEVEKRNKVGNWIHLLLIGVHKHTSIDNQCPPGSKMQVLSSLPEGRDLIGQIASVYSDDPLSALGDRQRRQLFFRYSGPDRGTFQCLNLTGRNICIEFPDLCYVLVSEVEVIYHACSYESDAERVQKVFQITTGDSSKARCSSLYTPEQGCTDTSELFSHRVAMEPEICKWVSINFGRLRSVKVHDVRVYGQALILM